MLLELLLLIGSYNDASQESIQLYSFNQESGQFAYVSGAKGVTNPTFLCTNAAQDVVYAVGEYDEDDKATMNALHLDKQQGSLSLFSTQLNGSGAPCNISLTPDGKQLVSANYTGGSLTFYDLLPDGSLSRIGYQPTGIHPRNFALTPNDRYLLVACRDSNAIQIFERDASSGLLKDTGRSIEMPRPMFVSFLN